MTTLAIAPHAVLLSEMRKTRRSRGWLGAVLVPLVVVALGVVFLWTNPPQPDATKTDLYSALTRITAQVYFLLWPMIVAVGSYLLADLEHRDRGIKFVFTLPVARWTIFAAKAVILWIWVAISLFVGWLGTLALAAAAAGIYDVGGAAPDANIAAFTTLFWKLGIVLFAVAAVHYLLSLTWSHFAISVGAAVFLNVLGSIIAFRWEHADWVLYAFPSRLMGDFIGGSSQVSQELPLSAAYAAVALAAGYALLRRRSVRD